MTNLLLHRKYGNDVYTVYVTGFDKNRLGRTHQKDSFSTTNRSLIHKLTVNIFFTVHSSSVCFLYGLFLWPVWHPQVHGCSLNGSGAS